MMNKEVKKRNKNEKLAAKGWGKLSQRKKSEVNRNPL